MLSLKIAILLGSVCAGGLIKNVMLKTESLELIISILFAIVRPKHLNLSGILILN